MAPVPVDEQTVSKYAAYLATAVPKHYHYQNSAPWVLRGSPLPGLVLFENGIEKVKGYTRKDRLWQLVCCSVLEKDSTLPSGPHFLGSLPGHVFGMLRRSNLVKDGCGFGPGKQLDTNSCVFTNQCAVTIAIILSKIYRAGKNHW